MTGKTNESAYTPRSGRVGNFLVKEEIIEREDAEPLSRLHVTDIEGGWEVVIPQTYASAYNIVSLAVDEEMNNAETEKILHWVFDNFFVVTTCLDGNFHTLIRDIALIGFTPAVNKKSVKERKQVRKYITERLRAFEFPTVQYTMTEEEEHQDEIAVQAKDILDQKDE